VVITLYILKSTVNGHCLMTKKLLFLKKHLLEKAIFTFMKNLENDDCKNL